MAFVAYVNFFDHLIQVHQYKLKGDEPLQFHLGCDFGCDRMVHATINQKST